MIQDLVFVIIVWEVSLLLEWLLHKLGHTRIAFFPFNEIHRIHMEHHKIHYPVNQLLAKGPYKEGGGWKAFGPIIAVILFSAYGCLSWKYFVVFAMESMLLLKASVYLHDHYHIEGSWLERYHWFIERRYRHFYHHGHHLQNMSLGGIDPTFDKLFGVFVDIALPEKGDPPNTMPKKRATATATAPSSR